MRPRRRVLAPALAALLLLSGCAEQGNQGTSAGVADVIQQWKSPDTAPVAFAGPTVDGATFDSKRYLGRVVVVNFWYAGCAPCRAEAPVLQRLAKGFAADRVQFVGVNTYDSADTAASFDRTYGTAYPSILDQAGGASVQLAFASFRGPKDIPSTLVLDRKGRVTARYSALVNESNLRTLIQDAVDGKAA